MRLLRRETALDAPLTGRLFSAEDADRVRPFFADWRGHDQERPCLSRSLRRLEARPSEPSFTRLAGDSRLILRPLVNLFSSRSRPRGLRLF